jgi:hypothetical protein
MPTVQFVQEDDELIAANVPMSHCLHCALVTALSFWNCPDGHAAQVKFRATKLWPAAQNLQATDAPAFSC